MKKAIIYLFVFVCVAAAGNHFFNPANAQTINVSGKTNNSQNKTVSSTPDLAAKLDLLIEKANAKQSVRVIVGVRTAFQPEGGLSRTQAENQRAAIKQAQTKLLDKLADFQIKEVKEFEFIPFLALEADAAALMEMKNMSEIVSVEEDELLAPTLEASTAVIGAPQAWNIGFSGANRTVAVLDTGVDKNHPFFGGRVVSEACYSTTDATQGATSACPGGVAQSTAPNSGLNCDINIVEGCMHGTHVAGIVGGRDNNLGRYGVARDVNLIAVQVFSMFSGTNCGGGNCTLSFTSDQIRGLERVYALRNTYTIDAVNLSLGGGKYTTNCDAEKASYKAMIDNLRSANIATIIASGNNGYSDGLAAPACISTAISVGSTHDGDAGAVDSISSFSNSASFLSILAPGQLITSAFPGGTFEATQGTSMAAPHVAGAWSVLKQKYPTETVSQIFDRLNSTGKPITDSRNNVTKNRIRLDYAIGNPAPDPCENRSAIGYNQTITTQLTTSDCLESDRYRDRYTFAGVAGQPIAVEMNSADFDTYLYLYDSNNLLVADNDDIGGGNTNSRIPRTGTFTLPTTGTYTIMATSYGSYRVGTYSIQLIGTGPSCSYAINPGSANIAAAGGNGSVSVTTQAGCAWTAASNAPAWLSVSGTANGTGSGTVNFTVAQNTSNAPRTGTMTIAGQSFTVNQSSAAQPPSSTAFDFDGDGKADVSVFRPSNGVWYLNQTSAGVSGVQFGISTDRLAPADYDGDGKTDIAVYRNGFWYLLRSTQGFTAVQFGIAEDKPVPADFDGDGRAELVVYRPSNGTWYVLNLVNNNFSSLQFGLPTDKPLVGDYDGDGRADYAVFRPSNGIWYYQQSSNGFGAIQFGLNTDKPVPADYDGDGKTDVAVYRPSNGVWYLLRSTQGFMATQFGISTDLPAPADYDGDGKTDLGVYRNGNWYMLNSQVGFTGAVFGSPGDKPAPNAFIQ